MDSCKENMFCAKLIPAWGTAAPRKLEDAAGAATKASATFSKAKPPGSAAAK